MDRFAADLRATVWGGIIGRDTMDHMDRESALTAAATMLADGRRVVWLDAVGHYAPLDCDGSHPLAGQDGFALFWPRGLDGLIRALIRVAARGDLVIVVDGLTALAPDVDFGGGPVAGADWDDLDGLRVAQLDLWARALPQIRAACGASGAVVIGTTSDLDLDLDDQEAAA